MSFLKEEPETSQGLGYTGKKKNHPCKAVFSNRVSQRNSNHLAVCIHRAKVFLLPVLQVMIAHSGCLTLIFWNGTGNFFPVCTNI